MTTTVERTTLAQVVAANIRAEAARRGWIQAELAKRLGMSRIAISDRHRERTPWTLDEVGDTLGSEIAAASRTSPGNDSHSIVMVVERAGMGSETVAKLMGLEVGDLVARPKGFEPLTFWLGADHTITGINEVEVFCDLCGWAGVGSPYALFHARAHGVTSLATNGERL